LRAAGLYGVPFLRHIKPPFFLSVHRFSLPWPLSELYALYALRAGSRLVAYASSLRLGECDL
jgi:hypothetical protein